MPNEVIQREYAGSILGVPGRFYNVVANTDKPALLLNQRWDAFYRPMPESVGYGKGSRMTVEIRFDDECGNGKNSFAITGEIRDPKLRRDDGIIACGCLHDEIAVVFPELAPLIKWHLTDSESPLHYVANTVYLAGDRDCHGLREGEERQIRNGRTGLLAWKLAAMVNGGFADARIDGIPQYVDAATQPPQPGPGLVYRPWNRIGEGKPRQLDAARRAAAWPEATDEQLCAPREELEAALLARLPGLGAEFRETIIACGLLWDQSQANQIA